GERFGGRGLTPKMLALLLLPLGLVLPRLQDPVPPPPPPPPEKEGTPESGPAPSPETQRLMNEINDLIEKVQDGFKTTDQAVNLAREAADQAREDDSDFRQQLAQASDKAQALLDQMEELLAKLPESESKGGGGGSSQSAANPPPDGQGGSGRVPASDPGRQEMAPGAQEKARDGQKNKDDPDSPQGSRDKGEEGNGALPPEELLRRRMFLDLRKGFWGALPPRLQGALENANAEDLPLRYRRWLVEFHRRSSGGRP
ncbi:MAG: hypothetical protein ACE5H3_09850, partial [Planctomycetota bacterium]